MTHSLYICGDTQKNAVRRAGAFRAQKIQEIDIVAWRNRLEASHVANDHSLWKVGGRMTHVITTSLAY